MANDETLPDVSQELAQISRGAMQRKIWLLERKLHLAKRALIRISNDSRDADFAAGLAANALDEIEQER
jgi:hypothetical protein